MSFSGNQQRKEGKQLACEQNMVQAEGKSVARLLVGPGPSLERLGKKQSSDSGPGNWHVLRPLSSVTRSTNGHGSKPMVPFWRRCTTHFSLF